MALKTVLFFVAAMAASISIPPAGAQDHGRVFELRTYTCNEGKLPDLLARFRNHTTRIFERHGMTNIAYWVPQDSPAHEDTLIYIIAHASREAAKKNWDEFRNDPEWQKVQKDSEANGKIVSKVESVFMDPADFSPVKLGPATLPWRAPRRDRPPPRLESRRSLSIEIGTQRKLPNFCPVLAIHPAILNRIS